MQNNDQIITPKRNIITYTQLSDPKQSKERNIIEEFKNDDNKKDQCKSNSKSNSFVISIKELDHSFVRNDMKINFDSIPNGTQQSKNSSPSLRPNDFKSKIELLKKKKKFEMVNGNKNNIEYEQDLEFTPIICQIHEPEVKVFQKEHKANIHSLSRLGSNNDGLKRSTSQSSNKVSF